MIELEMKIDLNPEVTIMPAKDVQGTGDKIKKAISNLQVPIVFDTDESEDTNGTEDDVKTLLDTLDKIQEEAERLKERVKAGQPLSEDRLVR